MIGVIVSTQHLHNTQQQDPLRWMPWALGEGVLRTTSRTFQKVIGTATTTIGETFLATAIIGIVQIATGAAVCRFRGVPLLAPRPLILWCLFFGANAVAATVLGFATFLHGGDIGVSTLIIALGIIPGALIDWACFGHRPSLLQWLAIALGLVAAWAMLDFPSLNALMDPPLWVGLAVANMLVVAANQGITQAARTIDPLVKNFWVGVATTTLCIPVVIALNAWGVDLGARFWAGSFVIGALVVALLIANLMSYKSGAWIAYKKLIVMGTYLTLATTVGVIAFDEPLTAGKPIGVALFLLAALTMQRGTRRP